MTPKATVLLISLTANLPSGGNYSNISTHIGLVGTIAIIAESPY